MTGGYVRTLDNGQDRSHMQFEFIIEQAGVKRWLRGSFHICAHASVLRELGEQLLKAAEQDTYGWRDINAPLPMYANVEPREWNDN